MAGTTAAAAVPAKYALPFSKSIFQLRILSLNLRNYRFRKAYKYCRFGD